MMGWGLSVEADPEQAAGFGCIGEPDVHDVVVYVEGAVESVCGHGIRVHGHDVLEVVLGCALRSDLKSACYLAFIDPVEQVAVMDYEPGPAVVSCA